MTTFNVTNGEVISTAPAGTDSAGAAPMLWRPDAGITILTGFHQFYLDAMIAPVVNTFTKVDIYEQDGTTIWQRDVEVISGEVSVDYSRDERRTIDMELFDQEGELRPRVGGLWYDKVIKVYKGLYIDNAPYAYQIGTFLIDVITDSSDSLGTVSVTGRDFTKKMMQSKFPEPTSFNQGYNSNYLIRYFLSIGWTGYTAYETWEIMEALAANCDIFDTAILQLPNGGLITYPTLTQIQEFSWDLGVSRWEACKECASVNNYDLWFGVDGQLISWLKPDPFLDSPVFNFSSVEGLSNLISLERSVSDAELFNHVVVKSESGRSGGGQDTTYVATALYGEAENTVEGSPTSIAEIGRRTKVLEFQSLYSQFQADSVAKGILRVSALEMYDINMESISAPWLDVGRVVQIQDRYAQPGDPDSYLLTSLSFPLGVGGMSATARRVTKVTDSQGLPGGAQPV